MSKSTILVQSVTRENLKKIAHKGQSYDSLIEELLQVYLESKNSSSDSTTPLSRRERRIATESTAAAIAQGSMKT